MHAHERGPRSRFGVATLLFLSTALGCQGLLGIEDGKLRPDERAQDATDGGSASTDASTRQPDAGVTAADAGGPGADAGSVDAGRDVDGGDLDAGSRPLGSLDAGPPDSGSQDSGPETDLSLISINEVVSTNGVPNDWIELFNAAPTQADVSNLIIKDDNDDNVYVIAAGTKIPAGGFLVLEQSDLGFGLGSADAARLFAADGVTIISAFSWTEHAATSYGSCPDGSSRLQVTTTQTKGAPNDCSARVLLNEIESSDGDPGDWVELYNAALTPVDVSGYVFRDDDDTHSYAIPNGTIIAAGRYLVLEEAQFGFGLGGSDAARLFLPDGTTLVDSYAWQEHAPRTYGRCPAGGPFISLDVPSKGTANPCEGELTENLWPGLNNTSYSDSADTFDKNLSGLTLEPGASAAGDVLWAVQNSPSVLYRLLPVGTSWTPDAANAWGSGKTLNYPDGAGSPDAEGVTRADFTEAAAYVTTERDNDDGDVSRLSVLRFDTAAPASDLVATHEWNLTGELPAAPANRGLEGITWIPDAALVAKAYYDENLNKAYDPLDYPSHGSGLFVVGVEATGVLYVFALSTDGSGAQKLSEFSSGHVSVNALELDRDVGYLWSYCGASCADVASVIDIDTTPGSNTHGRFVVRAKYQSPSSLSGAANEGIALGAELRCSNGMKPFIWTDDAANNNHALLADTVPCGAFVP